jgi:hypothetical protein
MDIVDNQEACVNFFLAAADLHGMESSLLPGRERMLHAFRKRHRWKPGSPDAWKVIVPALKSHGLIAEDRKRTELANGLTIGQVLHALRHNWPNSRSPRKPGVLQASKGARRARKQAAPRRALQSQWP